MGLYMQEEEQKKIEAKYSQTEKAEAAKLKKE